MVVSFFGIGVDGENAATNVASEWNAKVGTLDPRSTSIVVISKPELADEVLAKVTELSEVEPVVQERRIWPVFLVDESSTLDLKAFDEGLDAIGPHQVDLVLVTSEDGADQTIESWLKAKIDSPPCVLSRLPHGSGELGRYVALRGDIVALGDEKQGASKLEGGENIPERSAVIVKARTLFANYLKDEANPVRLDRETLFEAIDSASSREVLQFNTSLDSTLANLKSSILDGVPDLVVQALDDVEAEADHPLVVDDLANQTEADEANDSAKDEADYISQRTSKLPDRDAALSEFLLANSKAGLSKLLGKPKLKAASQSLKAAIDRDIESVGQSLRHSAEAAIEPAVDGAIDARLEEHRKSEEKISSDLAEKALKAQVKKLDAFLDSAMVPLDVDLLKLDRPWTTGNPAARRYLYGNSETAHKVTAQVVNAKDDAISVELSDSDLKNLGMGSLDVFVLTAQYGLPVSSINRSETK